MASTILWTYYTFLEVSMQDIHVDFNNTGRVNLSTAFLSTAFYLVLKSKYWRLGKTEKSTHVVGIISSYVVSFLIKLQWVNSKIKKQTIAINRLTYDSLIKEAN